MKKIYLKCYLKLGPVSNISMLIAYFHQERKKTPNILTINFYVYSTVSLSEKLSRVPHPTFFSFSPTGGVLSNDMLWTLQFCYQL